VTEPAAHHESVAPPAEEDGAAFSLPLPGRSAHEVAAIAANHRPGIRNAGLRVRIRGDRVRARIQYGGRSGDGPLLRGRLVDTADGALITGRLSDGQQRLIRWLVVGVTVRMSVVAVLIAVAEGMSVGFIVCGLSGLALGAVTLFMFVVDRMAAPVLVMELRAALLDLLAEPGQHPEDPVPPFN